MHIQYRRQVKLASCYMEFGYIRSPFLVDIRSAEIPYVFCYVSLGIDSLVQEFVVYCSVEVALA